MSQFANSIKIAAALAFSTVTGPAAERERPPAGDARVEALERRANVKANTDLMQGVRAYLKNNDPLAALEKIIPDLNNPERVKALMTLRDHEKASLLSVDSKKLAEMLKLEDPAQAKPTLEKGLYSERSLKAAEAIRELIDTSLLKDVVDPGVFGKIKALAGNLKHEMPGLLTKGSYASEDGFSKDMQSLLEKMPKDDQKAAEQNLKQMMNEFSR